MSDSFIVWKCLLCSLRKDYIYLHLWDQAWSFGIDTYINTHMCVDMYIHICINIYTHIFTLYTHTHIYMLLLSRNFFKSQYVMCSISSPVVNFQMDAALAFWAPAQTQWGAVPQLTCKNTKHEQNSHTQSPKLLRTHLLLHNFSLCFSTMFFHYKRLHSKSFLGFFFPSRIELSWRPQNNFNT